MLSVLPPVLPPVLAPVAVLAPVGFAAVGVTVGTAAHALSYAIRLVLGGGGISAAAQAYSLHSIVLSTMPKRKDRHELLASQSLWHAAAFCGPEGWERTACCVLLPLGTLPQIWSRAERSWSNGRQEEREMKEEAAKRMVEGCILVGELGVEWCF